MIQRIGKRKFNIWAMDVESHNDIESIKKKETSIWLGCLLNEDSKIDDEASYFYTIEEFLDRLEALSEPKRTKNKTRLCKNICVYIYNLSFEWSFILPKLLERGFEWNIELGEKTFNSVSTKSCSSVWEVNLKFRSNYGIVKLRDLAKIFGGGLGNVAKSFELETQKGEIDYRLNRLGGWIPTKEEKEYCFKDTYIIIEILKKMQGDNDFWNAISMASYSMKKLIKFGFGKFFRPLKEYRKIYPHLSQEENEFLRESVAGGITYAPDRYQFKMINQKIMHIDAHQMHPTQMYTKFFPYGEGEYFTGNKKPFGKICCLRIRISYSAVRLHSVISLIGLPFITDKELVVWDFEIPTMRKCYVDFEFEIIEGYAYKMKPLSFRNYVKDNYAKRLKAKARKDAFGTLYYKLLNNSAYGKFLEKPHNVYFSNTINQLGIIDSNVIEKPIDEIEVEAKYTYLPVGSCIPAYSRVMLIETALLFGWEKICYFDTDSIFVIYDEDVEKVWNKLNQQDFLGGWGLEEMIDQAQFTAPKRYKTLVNGKANIKAGGINFDKWKEDNLKEEYENLLALGYSRKEALEQINLPFDEINIVSEKYQVQRAYRVKGGTIIEFQEKEVKIPGKYIEIYNRNKD